MQDVDLIVNPDSTFFRSSWSKHTNFSMQDIEIAQISGQMAYGQQIQFQLTRSGDLVSNLMLFIQIDPIQIDPSISEETVNATKYRAYTDSQGTLRFLSKTWVDDLARALVQSVKLTVGSYEIETQSGDHMHMWDKMTRSSDRSFVDTCPVAHGGVTKFNDADFTQFDGSLNYGTRTHGQDSVDPTRISQPAGVPIDGNTSTTQLNAVSSGFRWAQAPQTPGCFDQFAYPQVNRGDTPMYLYLPLSFTMCQSPGLALPMIALQYHDVKISVNLAPIEAVSIFNSSGGLLKVKDAPQIFGTGAGLDMKLVARYVFLDDAERRSAALSPHQFLITEIQSQNFNVDTRSSRQQYQLYFNHPVTELFCYFRKSAYADTSSPAIVNNWWNWTMDGNPADPSEATLGAVGNRQFMSSMNLSLNQQKLWDDARDAIYFTWLLVAQYHTRVPTGADRVAIIPFALDCEGWRPSGSTNFSRIDAVNLLVEYDFPSNQHLPSGTLTVNARSSNIFKVGLLLCPLFQFLLHIHVVLTPTLFVCIGNFWNGWQAVRKLECLHSMLCETRQALQYWMFSSIACKDHPYAFHLHGLLQL